MEKLIQRKLLEAMQHLDSFCRLNEIEYFFTGGTLLGTVRHKGFIPWDSDIDIVMKRKDYNKFLKLYNNSDSRYKLQNNKIDSTCPVFFSRLLIKNTTLCLKQFYVEDNQYNIYIDIFPLDTISNPNNKFIVFIDKLIKVIRRMKYYKNAGRSSRKKTTKVFLGFLSFFLTHKMAFYDILLSKLIKMCSNENGEYLTNFYGSYGVKKESHKKNLFVAMDCVFEGNIFVIPKGYHTILTNLYGNYMELPPEEKRNYHDYDSYVIKI